ncbi:DNA translocase FtsK, partial [Bosea sp. Leaf344]|uniref:DNA translocase FtsK n=1 Tax=Bosea sp. Leaf344 TaxID=1736346 RepID=UPI000B00616D
MPSSPIYVRTRSRDSSADTARTGLAAVPEAAQPAPPQTVVRYTRTPDRLLQRQAPPAEATPAQPADSDPRLRPQEILGRVRFGRTPDHMLQQVWLPSRAEAPVMAEAPPQAVDVEAEAPLVIDLDPVPASDPIDTAPAALPFAHISDFAFWEGLPAAPALPADAPEPDRDGIAPPPADSVSARPLPQAAPLAMPSPGWSSLSWSGSYSISLALGGAVGTPAATAVSPAPAAPAIAPAAAPAVPAVPTARSGQRNSVPVSRRERGEPAPTPAEPAPTRRRSQPQQAAQAEPAPEPVSPPAPAVFELPPIDFLAEPPQGQASLTIPTELLQQNAGFLEGVLEDFNVRGEIVQACPGPVVTLYELEPAPGTKSSRVISLADDIARSMSAISARVAVIPGKNAIGVELPNAKRETVYLRELLASQDFESTKHRLALCLGKTIGG